MALAACRECGGLASSEAAKCPHCGAKDPTGGAARAYDRRMMRRGGCLLILVALVVILANLPDGRGTAERDAEAERRTGLVLVPRDPWTLHEERNEMDGTPEILLSRRAQEPVELRVGAARPSLVIRCRQRRTEVYVSTDIPVEHARVRLRFDSGASERQYWSESTDGEALFSPQPIALARRLVRTDTFRLEFTPLGQSPVVSTFPMWRLAEKVPHVATACGWRITVPAPSETAAPGFRTGIGSGGIRSGESSPTSSARRT